MRIYSRMYEAVKETERELVEMGTRVHPETMQDKNVKNNDDFETIELQGYGYVITSHVNRDNDFEKLGGNLKYAMVESNERIQDRLINPGSAYKIRKEVWGPFLDKNGKFSYTYNSRIREQIEIITEELKERPNTRQAVITMYDRHQDIANLGGIRRIPCSMYYQFLRRKRNKIDSLDCIYTMRSCDFYTHYIYDVYLTMRLQEYIANSIGIESGNFTHFIGSLHAYKKDYSKRGVF